MRTRRRTREAGLDASHPPRSDPWDAPTRADRLRQVANILNLSTPCGLFVALVGGADLASGPRGTVIATGYRWRVPAASAFTLGDVVISRLSHDCLIGRPRLLVHETRHATQYACCLGLPMLPAYGLAAGWSWLRAGDPASRNLFERRAGLVDGGYAERPLRRRGGPPR